MKKAIILTISCCTISLFCLSQLVTSFGKESDIPYNKETGLVSISNVLIIPDATKTSKQIKAQIANFFETNSFGGTKTPNRLSKKNKDKLPQFSAGITVDQDSLLIYDCNMELNYYHTAGPLGTLSKEGGDEFGYKLKLFFKKGKVKYEFTNFTHGYAWEGMYKGFSGGRFENEKPERTNSNFGSKKSDWLAMKCDALYLINNIAKALEKELMNSADKNNFNF